MSFANGCSLLHAYHNFPQSKSIGRSPHVYPQLATGDEKKSHGSYAQKSRKPHRILRDLGPDFFGTLVPNFGSGSGTTWSPTLLRPWDDLDPSLVHRFEPLSLLLRILVWDGADSVVPPPIRVDLARVPLDAP
jgi:hypothetical protein